MLPATQDQRRGGEEKKKKEKKKITLFLIDNRLQIVCLLCIVRENWFDLDRERETATEKELDSNIMQRQNMAAEFVIWARTAN